jgi:outer membrane protein OmpA-like peptidoglycan-associated protein
MLSNCGTKVAKLAAWFNEHPGVDVELTGYLDQGETPKVSPALAENRMEAVREALIKAGVQPTRIHMLAATENWARCSDSIADTCQQWNRRVEVKATTEN